MHCALSTPNDMRLCSPSGNNVQNVAERIRLLGALHTCPFGRGRRRLADALSSKKLCAGQPRKQIVAATTTWVDRNDGNNHERNRDELEGPLR